VTVDISFIMLFIMSLVYLLHNVIISLFVFLLPRLC